MVCALHVMGILCVVSRLMLAAHGRGWDGSKPCIKYVSRFVAIVAT